MLDPHLRLERLLWRAGARRLPSQRALDAALAALPRGALWRICEGNPHGPLYLLPTRPWIDALGRECARLGRRVLEVAAGDGFVSRCLAEARPDLEVLATDSGAWERPRARMTAAEARTALGRRAAGIPLGAGVLRLDAVSAVRRFRPDVVLAIWLPPGTLLQRLVRAPCGHVLEIGAPGGVTAGGFSDWRSPHALLDGPVAALARCRLDSRPKRKLHTRVTIYRGGRS
ncbi:MAG: class I SAM-dependent methyltransferase [Myxococcales bacterium]